MLALSWTLSDMDKLQNQNPKEAALEEVEVG